MAMISVECPDCGRVLMRLPATGGTNQTKMCTGCKNRFRVIKDARTGSIRVERAWRAVQMRFAVPKARFRVFWQTTRTGVIATFTPELPS